MEKNKQTLQNFKLAIGFIGAILIVFYGVPLYWNVQKERNENLQETADPMQFTSEEATSINSAIDAEIEKQGGDKSEQQQFTIINQWVRERTTYESDLRNYGTPEYFATAREAYLRKKADCQGIAALVTSILRLRNVGQAKIATSQVHAEPSLTSDVLPPPVAPVTTTRHFEILLEKLIVVPWARLILAAAWFYMLSPKRKQAKAPQLLIATIVATICIGFACLELFTREYVRHPNLAEMTSIAWITLVTGASIILTATTVWTLYRIYFLVNRKTWALETSPV